MIKLTGTTLFTVRIDMNKMALCNHANTVEDAEPTCRACSIGLAMNELGTVEWFNDEINPYIRIIKGQVETDHGRFALSRLLAFAQGHIDPIDLLALHRGEQPFWEY